jgi:nicotinate-nucleotide pyrophosphorylase (carboxylating)
MDFSPIKPAAARLVRAALREDLGDGDATTEAFVPREAKAKGAILFRRAAVVCGLPVAHLAFHAVDPRLLFRYEKGDGEAAAAGETAALVIGRARSILKAERTALNFLGRLSGIATLTRTFVERLGGIEVRDTRKTTPGLRLLEKYAVRAGGGVNHRADLSEIMIKDNHIAAVGADAVAARLAEETRGVTAEATDAETAARWASFPCVRRILLDNMEPDAVREAVARIRAVRKRVAIEVTGGVTLENAARWTDCGIDAVSIGALTHSAPAADVSLELAPL